MKFLKFLIVLSINSALNQPAIAESNISEVFNKESNPHELNQDEIVNCTADNSMNNKDFQLESNDMTYKDCKKVLSKLLEQLKRSTIITCDQDIQLNAAIMNKNGLEEKGQINIQCEKWQPKF